jgi:hypothetical protein
MSRYRSIASVGLFDQIAVPSRIFAFLWPLPKAWKVKRRCDR